MLDSIFQLLLEDGCVVNHLLLAFMLGDEIRKARQEADMTQEELAFAADISRNYVSLLELGQRSPTVEVLIRICRALGASAGEMVGRIERKRQKRQTKSPRR